MTPPLGRFVTIEGLDGSGKSTLMRSLEQALTAQGYKVQSTFEPGSTKNTKTLRNLILSPEESWDKNAETLLFLADRQEHLEKTILPALKEVDFLLCDRYMDSTLAYQCGAKGVPREQVERIAKDFNFKTPDLTLYLKLSFEESQARLHSRREARESAVLERFRAVSELEIHRQESVSRMKSLESQKESVHSATALHVNLEEVQSAARDAQSTTKSIQQLQAVIQQENATLSQDALERFMSQKSAYELAAQVFDSLATSNPERVHVLDAALSPERLLQAALSLMLPPRLHA